MNIEKFANHTPHIGQGTFVADTARIIGNVEIGLNASIFFGSVLRGDIEKITVGDGSNIQENSVFHTSDGTPCSIGKDVTVGHGVILHGCEVKNNCLIGMGSTVLDKAVIEDNCLIGANSLIPIGMRIPAGSLAFGAPAKVIRQLKPEEIKHISESARRYRELAKKYFSAGSEATGFAPFKKHF